MAYTAQIQANKDNPEHLEALFQIARRNRETAAFTTDLLVCFNAEPDNRLYAAWYYRLKGEPEQKIKEGANWKLAIPLAAGNGLVLWALSSPNLTTLHGTPILAWLAAPITALFVMAFLTLTSAKNHRRALLLGVGLVVVTALCMLLDNWVARQTSQYYEILLVPHLALLAWASIGVCLIGVRSSANNRFAFLVKSIEVFVTAGVYLIAGIAFGAITLGMFAALSIEPPEVVLRLIAIGGAGIIPLIAVATIYDPLFDPQDQDFNQGLSRFIATLMRLLLPLTIGVLVVYLFVIPFKFTEPFINRDVLIVYNAMLFAIMGLLVGATPLNLESISPRLGQALRWGILMVAVLAVLVSLYAVSALLYRTVGGGLTINRITMLGWNVINIALLTLLIIRQLGRHLSAWNERIKSVFSLGAYAYVIWSLFVVLVMPLVFR
ncbi:MAG: hypothetical protein ACWGO1_06625 [Anaerolineales bacterium]